MKHTILTHSGLYFDFLDPKPEQICIQDIAHALSKLPRFNGHTDTHYSVAQHCVIASRIAPKPLALAALLHDAAEAYTGDVVSPLKALLPEFHVVEERAQRAVFARFGVPWEHLAAVKQVDLQMLATEKRDLFPECHTAWHVIRNVQPHSRRIVPWPIPFSQRYYLEVFRKLGGRL